MTWGTGARRTILGLGVVFATLLAGLVLRPVEGAAGAKELALGSLRLPTLCPWHRLSGHDCPGCGLTRGVVLLLHGRPADALRAHPFSPVVLALLLLLLPPRVARLAGAAPWVERWDRAWLLASVIVVGLIDLRWAVGLAMRL